MDKAESLSHPKWECKHIVFIPKCRRRTLYRELRHYLGEVLRRLAEQKESRVEERHLIPYHVHMLVAIPPKYTVSQWWGSSKARVRSTWRGCMESGSVVSWGNTSGRGYFVSTVGRDEKVIREYIRNQEKESERLDQLGLWR